MLEQSVGLNFFLKSPKNKSSIRYIHLRITIDGISKETSTKRKWDVNRWNQKIGRAVGSKEDARTLNTFLDSLATKINQHRTWLMNNNITITAQRLIDFILGKTISKAKVLEEFQAHNNEMYALISKGEYSTGTYCRYVTARSHVAEFINYKYGRSDIEFRELNFEFIKDYEFYLKTKRNCNNNTALKYISNFKKIVSRAVAKSIISADPFKLYKSKWTKTHKMPLTRDELLRLEVKIFSTERLTAVRDIFIFQCYTGLAYIDVFQLKKTDIKKGDDGGLWIMSNRQKSKSSIDIPLLDKAIAIIEKYKNDPICISRNSVLPVKSNQKMNEYLKEIATLCNITSGLNTHKARRTFGSTVTLNNGVPIHVVKKLLGHHSVRQTEEYAITEQETVSKEMRQLHKKLEQSQKTQIVSEDISQTLNQLKQQLLNLETKKNDLNTSPVIANLIEGIEKMISKLYRA